MQHSLFHQHLFLPDKQIAVDGECYEVLLGIIAHYENEQMPVKHGIMWHSIACSHADIFLSYSNRKHDMATLVHISNYLKSEIINRNKLYDDIGSFHSIIKKAAQEAIPSSYALYAPPFVISWKAWMMAVKDKAASLLQDLEYLWGEPDKHVHDLCWFMSSDKSDFIFLGKETLLWSCHPKANYLLCILYTLIKVPSYIPWVSAVHPIEGSYTGHHSHKWLDPSLSYAITYYTHYRSICTNCV